MGNRLTIHALVSMLFATLAAKLTAGELRVLSSIALRPVLAALAADYQAATGDKLVLDFETANSLKARIEAGERFDVAILTPSAISDLTKAGWISGNSTSIAKSGIGLAIRAGDTAPVIGSVEALKRTLLSAQSVAYSKSGASGIYFIGLLTTLGIADEMKPRLKEVTGPSVPEVVVEGEAQYGVQLSCEIVTTPGVQLVGTFPEEIQNYTVFNAAVSRRTSAPNAAVAFIQYLKGGQASKMLLSKGMEPILGQPAKVIMQGNHE